MYFNPFFFNLLEYIHYVSLKYLYVHFVLAILCSQSVCYLNLQRAETLARKAEQAEEEERRREERRQKRR